MSSSPFGTPNMSGWASGPKGYIPWCGDGVRMMHNTIPHPTPGLKDILRVRYVLQCSVLPHYPLIHSQMGVSICSYPLKRWNHVIPETRPCHLGELS